MFSIGDIIETYFKIKQRGLQFLLSRLNPDGYARTRSAFNEVEVAASNYWIIPGIRAHWNTLISGNPQEEYADHVVRKYVQDRSGLRMLSLGCGAGSHEVKFARHPQFAEVKGIDLAPKLIEEANRKAREQGLHHLHYETANVYETALPEAYYDLVLFHSSLHHFRQLDHLLGDTIRRTLKPGGLLVIHEYAGPDRIQWTRAQLKETNALLKEMDPRYRRRFRLNNIKTRAYRPGRLRMILSDPSEAVESSNILPALHKYYQVEEEQALGGNLIMPLFKDIAHHFTSGSPEVKALLQQVFDREKEFLRTHPSDFVFGVYRSKQ